jgi:hypothetical protein
MNWFPDGAPAAARPLGAAQRHMMFGRADYSRSRGSVKMEGGTTQIDEQRMMD